MNGADPVVLLSHHIWTDRFGAAADIVGRRVQVNGIPTTEAGVLPEGFRVFLPAGAALPDPVDVWMPWGGG